MIEPISRSVLGTTPTRGRTSLSSSFRDRFRKSVEVLFLLPRQLDRDEDADMQPQRFLVDGRDVARDDAALFKKLDPAVAGRHGQADLVGELLHGHAAVGLQQAENL